ncbi:MAG: Ig-like domain-containing protein, partial [Bdellovibrionota bacterium]
VAGNTSSSIAQQWVRDTQAPVAPSSWTLSSPANGTTSNDSAPQITIPGNALEVGSTAKVYSDSGCTTQLGSAATIAATDVTISDISFASDGIKNFYGKITDKAGNATSCTDLSQSYMFETAAPSVLSIVRVSSSPANSAMVNFTVTFSEGVSGVDTADFTLTVTGVSGASISSVTQVTASQYTVAVATGSNSGTIRLDLTDDDSIVDTAGNNLGGAGTNNYTSGETYTIDKTAPTVTVNQAGAQADPVSSFPILYEVVFSESVTGFTSADVTIGGTATGVTLTVSGSGTTYEIQITGASASGTIIPSINTSGTADSAGNLNAASTSMDSTVSIDLAVPTVSSIVRASSNPSNSGAVNFTVTFSEGVSGVDTADFTLTVTGVSGASISSVTQVTASQYTVAVATGSNSGTIRLDLTDDDSIVDTAGNNLGGAGTNNYTSGETYTIDKTAPTVTVNQAGAQADPVSSFPILYEVVFSESVTGFTSADVTIGGTATGVTLTVSGSGTTYEIQITGASASGTIIPSINASGAADSAGNLNAASTSMDSTVTYQAPQLGSVKQVVAGEYHTCALLSTGKVRCWGNADYSQIGYGNTNYIGDNENPSSAGDVNVGGDVVQLTAGNYHTCALLSTGKVRCWGNASDGQLGYGNGNWIGDNETPASAGDVNVGGDVIQLTAGGKHTCALLSTGKVRCWGYALHGELGYGNINWIGDNETPASAGDVNVGGDVIQLTAGENHTCALLSTGKVRCWGLAIYGELGYGNTNYIGDNENPSSAGDVNVGGDVVQLTAGDYYTCALLSTGKVRCWGESSYGQLGYGNTNTIGDNETPASAGDVNIGGDVLQITAGKSNTCALLGTGKVRCWGKNEAGQLGYGNTNTIGNDETPASAGDVYVGGDVALKHVASGFTHSCALLSSGKVRCWGNNFWGQLGYGNTTDIGDNETPASAGDVSVGGDVVQVEAGYGHTCALLSTGKVRCWGLADRIGYGNTNNIGDDETPASAGDVNVGGDVVQISNGDLHTCVLLSTGKVRCWGKASSGRLGYGNANNIGDDETPASAGDVNVGGDVVQIATGYDHTCALLSSRKVRCWGDGTSGQLGYGNMSTIGDDETPASAGDVNVGADVIKITAGQYYTCALLGTGKVRCWGYASSIGYNGYAIGDDEAPASAGDVGIGADVFKIKAGRDHTCVLTSTGNVRCWGTGYYGQLGYGNTTHIGDNELPSVAGDVAVW